MMTRLGDRYLPLWRELRSKPEEPLNPEDEKKLLDGLKRESDSSELRSHDERESDRMQSSKESRLIFTIARV
jgi:hypothetical protein